MFCQYRAAMVLQNWRRPVKMTRPQRFVSNEQILEIAPLIAVSRRFDFSPRHDAFVFHRVHLAFMGGDRIRFRTI